MSPKKVIFLLVRERDALRFLCGNFFSFTRQSDRVKKQLNVPPLCSHRIIWEGVGREGVEGIPSGLQNKTEYPF